MSNAAPPEWIKSAPGLAAAHKFMLIVLWGYGPYARPELWVDIDGDQQPRKPARCWESCAVLAELTGQPVATVRNQLRKLAADGWIRRDGGSMRTLAWRKPHVFTYGQVATDGHPLATSDPGQICTPPGHTRPTPGHECIPKVATDGPLTFKERSIQLPGDVVEDATPLESSPDENTTAGNHEHPRSQDRPTAHGAGRADADQRGRADHPGCGDSRGPSDDLDHGRVPRDRRLDDDRRGDRTNRSIDPAGLTGALPEHAQASLDRAQRRAPDLICRDMFDGCPAARSAWLNSSEHRNAWAPNMRGTMLDLSMTAADVRTVLDAWEAEPRGSRPPMGDLWYRKSRAWVERAIGIERKPTKASGHHAPTAEACVWTFDEASP